MKDTDKKILVVGSANMDMIVKVSEIPKPGETVLGGKFVTASGGKGANQAVAASRLGGNTDFIACLGSDHYGDQLNTNYVADNINIKHIKRDLNKPTGVALIFVANSGENSIAVASGANSRLTIKHIQEKEDIVKRASILLLQLESPIETVEAVAKMAHEAGGTVILNPAPAQTLNQDLLRHVSIITPNQSEAKLLTGIYPIDDKSAKHAAEKLIASGVNTVILTMGEQGAFIYNKEIKQLQPGFKVNVVDTTAAGDTFNGALAVALAEDYPITAAVRFASAAAALAVTQFGAQPSIPTRSMVDLLLSERKV